MNRSRFNANIPYLMTDVKRSFDTTFNVFSMKKTRYTALVKNN